MIPIPAHLAHGEITEDLGKMQILFIALIAVHKLFNLKLIPHHHSPRKAATTSSASPARVLRLSCTRFTGELKVSARAAQTW